MIALPRANYVALPVFDFTGGQRRFLALHADKTRLVVMWQWHWGSTVLRAHTECGRVATVTVAEFDGLIRAKLMKRIGAAGAIATDAGRRVVE